MNNRDLDAMRAEMDAVDGEILDAFRRRMKLSAEIAEYKKANGLPVLDMDREKSRLDAIAKNVEDEMSGFVSKLYLTLADLSKDYQKTLLDESSYEDD